MDCGFLYLQMADSIYHSEARSVSAIEYSMCNLDLSTSLSVTIKTPTNMRDVPDKVAEKATIDGDVKDDWNT
jgi:hypothetical protein